MLRACLACRERELAYFPVFAGIPLLARRRLTRLLATLVKETRHVRPNSRLVGRVSREIQAPIRFTPAVRLSFLTFTVISSHTLGLQRSTPCNHCGTRHNLPIGRTRKQAIRTSETRPRLGRDRQRPTRPATTRRCPQPISTIYKIQAGEYSLVRQRCTPHSHLLTWECSGNPVLPRSFPGYPSVDSASGSLMPRNTCLLVNNLPD